MECIDIQYDCSACSYFKTSIFPQSPFYANSGLAANVHVGNSGHQSTLCLDGVSIDDIIHPPRSGINIYVNSDCVCIANSLVLLYIHLTFISPKE